MNTHSSIYRCLVRKGRNWRPEPDDQDFELRSNYFLSGTAPFMPSTDMDIPRPIIPRHGLEEVEINYYAFEVSKLQCRGTLHWLMVDK